MFNWLKRWFGSPYTQYQPGTGRIVAARNDTESGTEVTLQTTLSIPAVLHGLRTFAQTIGMLDFSVRQHLIATNAEGIEQTRYQIARAHPVHHLLHSEPNEFQNASEWRETMIAHAILGGDGISYIERNGNFRPTALLPLLPNRTKVQVIGGKLQYLTVVNGDTITLDPWNVYHVKGFSWNGVSGLPIIELMKTALGLDLAQTHFASKFYRHGANMGGIVEYEGALSDEARQNLKSSWHREYEGVGNAFRTVFLEEGMKYTATGTDPEAAQFIEGRQFSLGDMARVIGLPPHLLYDLSKSTNNNIEHQGITAVQYSFQPWTNKLEQEAQRKLLYESEKYNFSCVIDLKPLTRGDSTAQAAVDSARFNCLAITPNEIRIKDGLNPKEGGDSLYLNTAYLPLAVAVAKAIAATSTTPAIAVPPAPDDTDPDEGDTTPTPDPGAGIKPDDGEPGPEVPTNLIEDERAVFQPIVQDALGRILRREKKAIEAAIDKPELSAWLPTWTQQTRQHMAEVLEPVSKAAAAAGLKLQANYIDRHLERTTKDIEQILAADAVDRADAKWAVLQRWTASRIEEETTLILGECEEASVQNE